MYDLIGFWTVVTLATLSLLVPIAVILFWASDIVLYRASRTRFDLSDFTAKTIYGDRYKRSYDERFNTLLWTCFGFGICSLMILGMVFAAITDTYDLTPTNLVEFVAGAATILAPAFGWVGMVGSVFTLVFFVSRKVFDFCYIVKDKLDKLGE